MSRRLLPAVFLASLLACTSSPVQQTGPDRSPVDALQQEATGRSADLSSLSGLLRPGTPAQLESRLGVPTFLWAAAAVGRGATAGRAPARPTLGAPDLEGAARAHLARFAPAYGLDAAAVAAARLAELHDTGRGGIIARFKQEVGGIEVFRDELKVLMTRDADLVAIAGYLPGSEAVAAAGSATFTLRPDQALVLAAQDLTGAPVPSAAFQAGPRLAAGYRAYALDTAATAAVGAPLSPATRVKPVWFHLAAGLVPAYYLELETPDAETGSTDLFAYVVAADDGRTLLRHSLTADAAYAYRVWAEATAPSRPFDGPAGTDPTPHNAPDGFQPPFLAPNLVTLSSGPISTGDPWLPPGATETTGNNVEAYVDLFAPDGFSPGDFHASVSAPGVFDWTHDLTQAPSAVGPGGSRSQQLAVVTQLFYTVNFMHDWFYDSGFTEAAGNAQQSNYGRGGLEGDSIKAEAQDFGGRNNANMSTPADGSRPRMQMYLFDGPPGQKITVVSAPPALPTGDYAANTASFGPVSFDKTAPLVAAVPANGCGALTSDVTGAIALIDRGTCPFVSKAQAAEAAGAVGVIIANNAAGGAPGLGGSGTVHIPVLSISQGDGATFKAGLAAGAVQVRLFRPVVLDRDGALDAQIVSHEWGHYLSNRLIGDGNGLNANLAGGLGEGWSDFVAMLLTVRSEDVAAAGNDHFQGAYSLGGYATPAFSNPSNPYYFGIRRYPYSTDTAKDPLSYRHIADGNALPAATVAPLNTVISGNGAPNSEVHNTGEVWATMLWEAYAALLRDTVDNTTGRGLSFDQAQRRMKDDLVAALKVTPVNPTLLEARDALLSVAYARDPADYVLFAAAFARRGAGALAVSPDRFSGTNQGLVEDATPPVGLALTGTTQADDVVAPCGADGVLQANESGHLTVTLRNLVGGPLGAVSGTLTALTAGVSVGTTSLAFPASAGGGFTSATTPIELGALTTTRLDFTLGLSAPGLGDLTLPLSARANYTIQPASTATDDVESPHTAWTATPQGSGWQRLEVSPTDHRWLGPDTDGIADVRLVSPALQVGPGPLSLTFRHRYQFELDTSTNPPTFFDGGVIEVSGDDGVTWTDVGPGAIAPSSYAATALAVGGGNPLEGQRAFAGVSAGFPAFVTDTVSLGTAFAGQTVRLRFRIGSDLSGRLTGWEIDDLAFNGILNTPFDALVQAPTAGCPVVVNPPTAYAGPGLSTAPGTTVTLDGRGSTTPNGGALSYAWSQIGGPAVTLSAAGAAQPTFTAPAVTPTSPVSSTSAILTFALVVSDGTASSQPSLVTVTVTNPDRVPVADAGPAQTVAGRSTVTLDASGSSDADGDPLTFAWTQTAGSTVTLSSATAAGPTFSAPVVTTDATLTFRVVVGDGQVTSGPATVDVLVRHVPQASAGEAQTLNEQVTATLDGSGSRDAAGDPLTYAWTQTAGPIVGLVGATTSTATFTTPTVTGDTVLTFQLVVNDGQANSDPATVNVTVHHVGSTGKGGGCSTTPGGADPSTLLLLGLGLALLRRRRGGAHPR